MTDFDDLPFADEREAWKTRQQEAMQGEHLALSEIVNLARTNGLVGNERDERLQHVMLCRRCRRRYFCAAELVERFGLDPTEAHHLWLAVRTSLELTMPPAPDQHMAHTVEYRGGSVIELATTALKRAVTLRAALGDDAVPAKTEFRVGENICIRVNNPGAKECYVAVLAIEMGASPEELVQLVLPAEEDASVDPDEDRLAPEAARTLYLGVASSPLGPKELMLLSTPDSRLREACAELRAASPMSTGVGFWLEAWAHKLDGLRAQSIVYRVSE